MNNLVKTLYVLFTLVSCKPCCAAVNGGALSDKFYSSVRGYGWLAEDYFTSITDLGFIPIGDSEDSVFSFIGTKEKPVIQYRYNFHEGHDYELSGFQQHGDEFEAKYVSKEYDREFFKVFLTDEKGPSILLRRRQNKNGVFYRMYRRIGRQDSQYDLDKKVAVAINKAVIAGVYISSTGVEVSFRPDGTGTYGNVHFKYSVQTDYVLGPTFQIMYLKGFPGVGESGEVTFPAGRGILQFTRIKKHEGMEDGWPMEDESFIYLKPKGSNDDE